MNDKSHARLVVGVSADSGSATVDFIKFFDRDNITKSDAYNGTNTFLEVFRFDRIDETKNPVKSEVLVCGITVAAIGNADISISFDSVDSAKRIFTEAVSEYKAFLNKSKINDSFNLDPQFILIGGK